MKRKRGPKDKAKSISMMGKSDIPFMKKAKKPEADDKPHVRPGPPSINKNAKSQHSKRSQRLTGVKL